MVCQTHGTFCALYVFSDKMHQSYPPASSTGSRGMASSWSSFEEDAQSLTAEKLLQAMKEVQHGNPDVLIQVLLFSAL